MPKRSGARTDGVPGRMLKSLRSSGELQQSGEWGRGGSFSLYLNHGGGWMLGYSMISPVAAEPSLFSLKPEISYFPYLGLTPFYYKIPYFYFGTRVKNCPLWLRNFCPAQTCCALVSINISLNSPTVHLFTKEER